jgi:4-amino-4-deoxy-L-arabinose transferase-like glycosyltransferase
MYDALAVGGVIGYARRFLTILGTKPPLITVLPTPFFLLLGRNAHVAYGMNLVFMAILFGAVFCIGRRYWDTRVGLLAVYITGTMPLLYGLSRWFMTDFGLAALVCLAIYFLISSHYFDDPRKTFLLGVTCGIGLLMKVTSPLYVALPFFFVFCRRFAKNKSGSSSRVRHCSSLLNSMLVLALPVIWLAFPWYYFNSRRVFERVIISGFSDEADYYGTGPVFTLHAIAAYLIKLINMGPSVYYVGLLPCLVKSPDIYRPGAQPPNALSEGGCVDFLLMGPALLCVPVWTQ